MFTSFQAGLLHEVAELLFELGSEARLGILTNLNNAPLKMSQLAHDLSTTIQEVSRQCTRLEDSGLIEKHPDGKYGVTAVGKVALALLPSFELLQKERDYFATHDVSYLPESFIERMGELSEHQRLDHIDDALKFQQRVVKESEKFVWFMSDQPVGHTLRADHSHFSPNTQLRIILPKSVDTEVFRSARSAMESRLEVGLVDDVRLVIAMNEKYAAFGLPTLDGRSDYSRGFIGVSPTFHGWCRDLFSYYWQKAIKKYPEAE